MTDLLATIGHYPTPPDAEQTAAATPVARRLLDQARTFLGHHARDGHGDREDFWECAARLDAALHSGADRVWIHEHRGEAWLAKTPGGIPATPRAKARRTTTPLGSLIARFGTGGSDAVVHYGPISQHSSLWLHTDTRADAYATSRTFRRHAGRHVTLAGTDLDDGQIDAGAVDLADAMTAAAEQGLSEVVVKATRAKHGLWLLHTSTDRAANSETVFERLDWSAVHLGGNPHAFLVQARVPMRFEYRVFVVAGRLVTGAGCVEEATPLRADFEPDGSPDPFSDLVRESRGNMLARPAVGAASLDLATVDDLDGNNLERTDYNPDDHGASPAYYNHDAVQRLLAKAREVVTDASEDPALPDDYTLDLAIGPDGDALVVEFNGLTNAGLYASHPTLVARALVERSRLHQTSLCAQA